MNRINWLRFKLLVSGIHAVILLGPLALLSMACEKVSDGLIWLSDQLDTACGVGGKVLLPKWWPSHRILRALNVEWQRKREREADKLHDDRKERMFSRVDKR